mgnify:CR=1 FL=1
MSRPKKVKKNVEYAPPDEDSASSLYIESMRRQADPLDDDEFMLGSVRDLLIAKEPSKQAYAEGGAWLISLIRNLSPEDCKRMFAFIIKMKENLALPPSPQSYLLKACAEFIRDADRPPTKSELTDYILEQPERFPGMPPKINGTQWSRYRDQVGLDGLE